MYQRRHVKEMIDLILNDNAMRIIAATGPRQTGKTTIATQACDQLNQLGFLTWYIPLDNTEHDISEYTTGMRAMRVGKKPDAEMLINIWQNARIASKKSDHGLILVFDEIQTIPGWSNHVKSLWDKDRREGYKVRPVILGSAAWRMLIGINESLAGRFITQKITHWSYREITECFHLSVDEYIFFGGYPGAFYSRQSEKRQDYWHNYIQTSIMAPIFDRDIMGLTRIRKPVLMRRLMDLAPSLSGQLISYNKLLGQLQDKGNSTTIANYLDLLSDAGILTCLSRYTTRPHVGKASSPKLNVLNTALMTAGSGHSFPSVLNHNADWGRIVESAVGAHLLNSSSFTLKIHYWRDEPHEVDYIVSRGSDLLGIEVKSGSSTKKGGLNAFKRKFPKAKTMIVGPNGIPLNDFFSLTADEWLEEEE
ncbi:MAG: ATP-binding protein [Bacteroidetes bacterium]|nr:ATP-binding protein [Bacteroidota bacterium]